VAEALEEDVDGEAVYFQTRYEEPKKACARSGQCTRQQQSIRMV
jgi:hypothetical protein